MCPICGNVAEGSILEVKATLVKIQQNCTDPQCKIKRIWVNQPFIQNLPICNLLMSASIIMSGENVSINVFTSSLGHMLLTSFQHILYHPININFNRQIHTINPLNC